MERRTYQQKVVAVDYGQDRISASRFAPVSGNLVLTD